MSIRYHEYDSQNQPIDNTLAGNYTAESPSGGDAELSTLSSNWVENRVIAAKILQDEADYLSKVDGEARYAIEYRSTVPTTIKDKIYVINGDAFLGDSTNATLTQLSKVVTVNGQSPDANGNVDVGTVRAVDGHSPDNQGAVSFGLAANKWLKSDASGHITTTNDTVISVPSGTTPSTSNVDVVTGVTWNGTQIVVAHKRLKFTNGIYTGATSLTNTTINTVAYTS